jgi:hypothetical protein
MLKIVVFHILFMKIFIFKELSIEEIYMRNKVNFKYFGVGEEDLSKMNVIEINKGIFVKIEEILLNDPAFGSDFENSVLRENFKVVIEKFTLHDAHKLLEEIMNLLNYYPKFDKVKRKNIKIIEEFFTKIEAYGKINEKLLDKDPKKFLGYSRPSCEDYEKQIFYWCIKRKRIRRIFMRMLSYLIIAVVLGISILSIFLLYLGCKKCLEKLASNYKRIDGIKE